MSTLDVQKVQERITRWSLGKSMEAAAAYIAKAKELEQVREEADHPIRPAGKTAHSSRTASDRSPIESRRHHTAGKNDIIKVDALVMS
jgi:hypothetical protein